VEITISEVLSKSTQVSRIILEKSVNLNQRRKGTCTMERLRIYNMKKDDLE
jgi:hypothetical protein